MQQEQPQLILNISKQINFLRDLRRAVTEALERARAHLLLTELTKATSIDWERSGVSNVFLMLDGNAEMSYATALHLEPSDLSNLADNKQLPPRAVVEISEAVQAHVQHSLILRGYGNVAVTVDW